MRIATFNAGLAVGHLPRVTERLPHVVAALSSLDVDVLFVQEFWLDAHWEALRAALRFPHDMRPEASRLPLPPSGACAPEEVAALVACARSHCAGLRDEALARCVVRHCAHVAMGMSPPCLNCIAADPSGSVEEIIARCAGSGAASATPASARYGGLIAYGGSFGTGLLSRYPLEERDFLLYESSVNARGAMHALVVPERLRARGEVDGEGVHLFATHFSPGGAEHAPQVEALAEWVIELAGTEAPAILLGDLNMSSTSASFRILEGVGFHEPESTDRRGTFSSEGLETGAVRESGWRLDHVLVRGLPPTRTERTLDAPMRLPDGAKTTLSDHFAIVASIGAE